MKIVFIVFLLFVTNLYSKQCYHTKDKKVCFYPFYQEEKLKNPKSDEKYYKFKDGYVYDIKDKIKVTMNYTGGIMYILDNYDVEFFDKKDYNTFILRVKNSNELFGIATNLNRLDSVKIAEPLIQRKDYKPLMK